MTEYGGYVEIDDEESLEPATPRFVIEDDQTAEWAMKKIREANEEKAKWQQFYDERYARVCADADFTIANMEALLHTYFEKVPHKQTATQQSYALPSGKLVCKHQAPEYERDDSKIVEWLHKSGRKQFIKEGVEWGELKKSLTQGPGCMIDEDGEIVPGITVVERPDVFRVELKKEDK